MEKNIVVLEGDGVGPEVTSQSIKVLKTIADRFNHQFNFHFCDIGAVAIKNYGTALPAITLEACKKSDAILLGAVGDPAFGPEHKIRPEQGLLQLRSALGLYMNVRPVKTYDELTGDLPIKENIIKGTDILFLRELTGGIYFGEKKQTKEFASDLCKYTTEEIDRIGIKAFEFAMQRRKKVCLVDKANVLATSRLWRERVKEISHQFPEVELHCMYVDNAAMQIILNPRQFDVVLTENMFGDILTDEASVLAGSIGLLPSASIGHGTALYEPIHGSWPEAKGKNMACPVGSILSAAMMLELSFGFYVESAFIQHAVSTLIKETHSFETKASILNLSCSDIGNKIAQIVEEQQLTEV
jgi:3-isopropylmalate dehydrogenase